MTDDTEKTFVYDGREWQLTGRVAKKNIYHARKQNMVTGVMTILEICPLGIASSDPEFHKWVDPRELYAITELPESVKDSPLDLLERTRRANSVADPRDE